MELDKSIVESVNKANKKLGEFFYLLANEPSVGLYHVQEHIRKTIPKNTEIKREIRKKYQNIEAMTYDVNFSIQTVKSLHDLTTFATIKQSMDHCIDLLNSLNKIQQGRKVGATPTPTRPPVIAALTKESSVTPPTPPLPKSDNLGPQVAPPSDVAENRSEHTADIQEPLSLPSPSTSSDPTTSTTSTITVATASVPTNESDKPDHDASAVDASISNDNEEGLVHKKGKKTKKPKAAKNLSRNFDLTPKQF